MDRCKRTGQYTYQPAGKVLHIRTCGDGQGKSIDLSLRVLGFEMGRALITSDSVFVVIKPQRTYIAESLNEVTKYVSFTTGNIQDLLMGRPFLLSKSTITANDGKWPLHRMSK